MNYMILAAGKGSRMGSLSTYLQKCMYPVLDRPFLELVLQGIVANRYFSARDDRIVIVTGYEAEQITGYFGNSWRSIPLRYALQEEPLGTAHAVATGYTKCIQDTPTIVVQADVWASPGFYESLIAHPLDNALSIFRHECAFEHKERVDVEDGMLRRAWCGTGPFVECGIWKFSPELITYMMSRKEDEYRALASVQAAIEHGVPVAAVERDAWIHLGGTEPS
ncbi:MAG: NTP transferase domain-containing protein, partial [Spirochaetales bacterium]|nr:NTP transferase domain-containing protein [Spirochaetales bacterium]